MNRVVPKTQSIILPSATIALLIIAVALFVNDTTRLGWQHAARWTADLSAIVFLTIFVPQFRQIMSQVDRRQRVLGFVTVHLIHAGTFVAYHIVSAVPSLVTVLFGGLGYVVMGALALIPPLSAPLLHRFGIWYIWLIFIVTFAGGIGDNEYRIVAVIGVAAFAAAAIARVGLSQFRTKTGSAK